MRRVFHSVFHRMYIAPANPKDFDQKLQLACKMERLDDEHHELAHAVHIMYVNYEG